MFGKLELRAKDLYEKEFYYRAVERLKREYFRLRPCPVREVAEQVQGVHEWRRYVYQNGIETMGGVNEVLRALRGAKWTQQLTAQQLHRLKQDVLQSGGQKETVEPGERWHELNQKIKQATRYRG